MRFQSKYIYASYKNPQPIAKCDYSAVECLRKDLIPQMEYNANGLYFTGFYVHKKFADKPNKQNLNPILKPDPEPVKNPRPGKTVYSPQREINTIDVSGIANKTLTNDEFNYSKLVFFGTITNDVLVVIPQTFSIFSAENKTVGNFSLKIQMKNSLYPPIEIERGMQNNLYVDGYKVFKQS